MAFERLLGSLLFLLLTRCASSSMISDAIFESQVSTGRSLLQTRKSCPIDFENQNYTIITSQCKGPKYPPGACCTAFKEFTCPVSEEINDLSTDCADTMFSYINLYGKYPPGLFANECKEGKDGLNCTGFATFKTETNAPGKSSAYLTYVLSPVAMLSSCILGLLFLCLV